MDVNSNPEMQSNQEIQNDELNYGQREVETASPNQEIQNDESNDEQREKETASPNQEILNGALNDGQREDKTDTSASEYDKFFDCNSETCKKQIRTTKVPKIQTNMSSLISNMDSADNFRKTLSDITLITQNILKTLKSCDDNRPLRRSLSEKNNCSSGINRIITSSSKKEQLHNTIGLADKFFKTLIVPCEKSCSEIFLHKKHESDNTLEGNEFPELIPFEPFKVCLPVKIGKSRSMNTCVHHKYTKEFIVADTCTASLTSKKKLSESSSDMFFSLEDDTSCTSSINIDGLIKKFSPDNSQCFPLAKMQDTKKCKYTNSTSTSNTRLCLICKKPSNYCICAKPSLLKKQFEKLIGPHQTSSKCVIQKNVSKCSGLRVIYSTVPPLLELCKTCYKKDCTCETFYSKTIITPSDLVKSTSCIKYAKKKCSCKPANLSSQKCNMWQQPIETCICEKPQTSKTYTSDIPEQYHTSKYVSLSNLLPKSSLDACVSEKSASSKTDIMKQKCGVCGNDIIKCICKEPQSSKTATSPTVCQCGLNLNKCKCNISKVKNICSTCDLTLNQCACRKHLSRKYCFKCQKIVNECICKLEPQTVSTVKTCYTCGNILSKCICSKLKCSKGIFCYRCGETSAKCVCEKPKLPQPNLCNRCGQPLNKCVCPKAHSTQTDIGELCYKCNKPISECTCFTERSMQTDKEPICEQCGKELSYCYCNRTQAVQTDKEKYQRIICNKCKSKIYAEPGEEPITCSCNMEHLRTEKELTDVMAIDESDLEGDIIKCVCDLKELIPPADTFTKRTLFYQKAKKEESVEDEETTKPEVPPKPPGKVYRMCYPQHRDLDICKKCRFEPSPLIDQDGRVFCPGNCGCCLCPWIAHATPSVEDSLKHTKFKVCKCRNRGNIFTGFRNTGSDCSQASYFDTCPCRERAEAQHLRIYGYEMWDVNEKLTQKFRGEQVYLRDVREIVPTRVTSRKYLSSKLYTEEHRKPTGPVEDFD